MSLDPILKVMIVANKAMIPDLNYLEKEIEVNETWVYISDKDNHLYTFTNLDNGGLFVATYEDSSNLSGLIDKIEDDLEMEFKD
jgi:hypothetical protein